MRSSEKSNCIIQAKEGMIEELRSTFRYKMFKVVLLLSIPFWFFGGIKGLVLDGRSELIYLDMTFFFIALISFLIIQYSKYFDLATIVFCSSWLIGFVLYWKYQGGLFGPFSYAYFSLLVVFLGILPKPFKVGFVVTLCITCAVLSIDSENEDLIKVVSVEDSLINPLALDYTINAIILGIVSIYLKKSYDQKRQHLEKHNKNLNEINLELTVKRQQLVIQQKEIQRIKTNLEQLVGEHTTMLEEKNKQLADYAYDNAHIVRAPLSNILGILDILKLRNANTKGILAQLDSIRKNALQLDRVVRKINLILK